MEKSLIPIFSPRCIAVKNRVVWGIRSHGKHVEHWKMPTARNGCAHHSLYYRALRGRSLLGCSGPKS